MLCCFGQKQTSSAENKTQNLAVGNASNASAVARNETDAFDESATASHPRASRSARPNPALTIRQAASASPGTSRHPSIDSLMESSATEFWDKMGKSFGAFEDADNSLCDRLLLGLSRVKNLGSGGFASVFQARWRHVRLAMPYHMCIKQISISLTGSNGGGSLNNASHATPMQVDVAVKILISNGRDYVDEMTKVEAQICEGLRHPNVIQARFASLCYLYDRHEWQFLFSYMECNIFLSRPFQTFQTRRSVVTQAWIDSFKGVDVPLSESHHSSTITGELAQVDPYLMQCFESNDGACLLK